MNPLPQYAAAPAPVVRLPSLMLKAGLTGKGRFQVQVVDAASGRVVERRPWQNNLILDQGLNGICQSYNWGNAFIACAAGTGTTPELIDSGAITIDYNVTTPGGHATASAPFFTAAMVGGIIQLDTGEQVYITALNSNVDVSINSVAVVAAALGTFYAVQQTGLTTEAKRSTTYLVGVGNCGTTDVGNARTMRRTYDFTAEIAPVNYAELGWSNNPAAGANLFSRALIIGGTVTVGIGQALRVVYDLTVTISPNVSTAGNYAVTNWPVAPATDTLGNYMCTNPLGAGQFVSVDNNGNTGGVDLPLDVQALTSNINLSTSSVMPPFGTNYALANAVQNVTRNLQAYVLGTFNRTKDYTWPVASANRTDWRGVALGPSPNNAWVFIFGQAQTKDNLHTLTLSVNVQMGRTMVNP